MAILKQAFYPSLKGEAKEAASIGHKLEEPLCHKLFDEVPALKAEFLAPLLEKRGQPWVKGSVDFVTIIEDDGFEVEVTEIKMQTSVLIAGHEYDRVNRVNASWHTTIIDSDSPFSRDYIEDQGEALQILHHAVTYNCKYV